MRQNISVIAAAVLGLVAQAQAGFTLTAAPSTQAAPAGRRALDLFVQTDSDPSDGVNLIGASLRFTGANGTRVFFATMPNTPDPTYSVDVYNYVRSGTSEQVLDLGGSNFRIGTRTYSQHAYPLFPDDLSAADAANGLDAFQADYAVLGVVNTVPGLVAPGVRVARLVFNTASPAFTINGRFAGEIGPVSAASLTVVPEPMALAAAGSVVAIARRRRDA